MLTASNLKQPTKPELKALSESLEQSSPFEILKWAVDNYFPTLTMATAFGAEGCVLLSMLADIKPNGSKVRVFNLETGYQFAETLQLRETIRDRYGIEVDYVRATETAAEMEARLGGPIYGTNPDECCRIRKIEPLKQALEGYTAWISAIRRDQTRDRSGAGIVEWDPKFNLVKISPLANWTANDIWTYIDINEVPYNPLHKQGYPSIGCWPCTRPASSDDDERSGRWAGKSKVECGLHSRA